MLRYCFLICVLSGIVRNELLELTILHSNDIHSHYDQFTPYGLFCEDKDRNTDRCFGGMAKIETIIDGFRKNKKNLLLLDAGDQFQGTQFYSYFKGNASADLVNHLKYDLLTIGNHEFDDGPNNLYRYFEKIKAPIVCSNLLFKKDIPLKRLVKPYHIFPEYNLGIIGYITTDAKTISSPGPDIEFLDAVTTVQHYINVLKSLNITRIIGLSHYGYKEDIKLANSVTDLQLIVGGHSHSFLSSDPKDKNAEGPYPTITKNLDNNDVYIVQSSEWGKYLGHIDITFKDNKILNVTGSPIKIDKSIKEDQETAQIVKKYKRVFDEKGKELIGHSEDNFNQKDCRDKECSMGNLISDALIYNYQNMYPKNMLVSLINGGGIRAALQKGDVLRNQLEIIFPFENQVAVVNVTGKDLNKIFEGIVSQENLDTHEGITRTAQFGNIRVEYNSRAPKFNKLIRLLVRSSTFCFNYQPSSTHKQCFWESVDPHKTYFIATVDYVANGGDSILPSDPKKTVYYSQTLLEAVVKYIGANSPVYPYLDNRLHDDLSNN